jgi:hypothetical protein
VASKLKGKGNKDTSSTAAPTGLTVNGQPVPPEFAHVIPFANTDQGIAERNARDIVREDAGRAKVVAGPFEKGLEKMGDEQFLDTDPFKETVAPFRERQPGFSFKMLSERVIQKRGLRGFEVVKDEKGDPVKCGGMILGRMPQDLARRRNARFQELGNEALREAAEAYQREQEKVIREGGRDGLGVLRPGEILTDARDPEHAAVSGLHQTRGL